MTARIGTLGSLPADLLSAAARLGDMVDARDPTQRAHVDALLVTAFDTVDAALIAACPRLRFVSNIGTGTDHIDRAACEARGIVVTNTPDAVVEATADFAFGLLLAAARRIPEADAFVRQGHWHSGAAWHRQGVDVHGKTLGIVGFGRIGQAIARRAAGFDMAVRYHTRTAGAASAQAEWRPLPALLAESDFIVLQVPLTPQTQHLIGRAELALMKPTAVLVNTARGGVLDEDALVDALQANALGYAALDVFDNEPHVAARLIDCPRVLLAPHAGTATTQTRSAMAREALGRLQALLAGLPPAAAA